MKKGWIAVAVLVVAGIAAGAFLLGRSTPTPPTPAPPAEAGLQRGAAAANSVPGTGPGGVPQGFDHSPDGAASAAAAYRRFFDTQPPEQPTLTEALTAAVGRTPTAQQLQWAEFKRAQEIEVAPAAGAYALGSVSTDRVTVFLWMPTTTQDVGEEWFWMTAEMVWTEGQWRWPDLLKIAEGADSMTYGKIPPSGPAEDLSAVERKKVLERVPDPRFPKDVQWREWADAPR